MDFFQLATQLTEDKLITRQQRIYTDTLIVHPYDTGESFSIETTSFAQRQKIKFFLDMVSTPDLSRPGEVLYYRIGKYYEIEHAEQAQVHNTTGYFNFAYQCSENENGKFIWNLTTEIDVYNEKEYTFYLSSIVFEDSFYNPVAGWLNPANPDNFLDKVRKEHFKMELIVENKTELTYNGKPVFMQTFTGLNTDDVITDGATVVHVMQTMGYVDKVVSITGFFITAGSSYAMPYVRVSQAIPTANYCYGMFFGAGKLQIYNNILGYNQATVTVNMLYTKL